MGKMSRTENIADFYEVLNIPFLDSAPVLSKQQIKLAYHRALLKHHPDKASAALASHAKPPVLSSTRADHASVGTRTYTIDEITKAYQTLSDPALRGAYDRTLRLQRLRTGEKLKDADVFHTGLEVVDLEDMNYEEALESRGAGAYWYRSCRCGDEQGFIVTEDELEREAQHGEIVIGCQGCSLWMKVLFAVADDQTDEDALQDGDSKT
jgi:curved DNA-binding protein CbpA